MAIALFGISRDGGAICCAAVFVQTTFRAIVPLELSTLALSSHDRLPEHVGGVFSFPGGGIQGQVFQHLSLPCKDVERERKV